mgnify:CR=1 FL=1
MVVSYMPVKELSGTLVCVKDITESVYNVYNIRNVFVAVMAGFMFVLALFINQIVRRLLRQFYEDVDSQR